MIVVFFVHKLALFRIDLDRLAFRAKQLILDLVEVLKSRE